MRIDPLKTFEENVESVEKLMNFDREVQDIVITHVEALHQDLVYSQNIQNDHLNGKRTLDIIKQIRSNDSLRPRYEAIFNQAVVLLVSYFGSALSDCFRSATQIATKNGERRILDEEINFKIDELISREDTIGNILGDIIIQKKDISFQDMKSVHRAFKKYFGIQIEKNQEVNDIILGQACRHAIVHNGGKINSRIIHQLASSHPRTLKLNLVENEDISFTTEEVVKLSLFMKSYISDLQSKISQYEESAQ